MSQLQGTDGQVYEIGPQLGEGGFGVTYGAQRLSDGQAVVIKQLRVERLSDWKAVELFEREAQVLQNLRHERIPSYLDFVPLGDPRAPQGFALVQQRVEGDTLQGCISSGRRLEMAQMQRWFVEVLEVLVYLHGLSPPVIHRDITPKNIILSSSGQAFLIDFGTVQAAMVSVTAVGSTTAGTFGYAPMEQFVGRATPSSDLYSLAITFAAVLMGQPPERMPFRNNHLDLNAALQGHQIDARLRLELERMVQPDPSRRPQSAQEVLHNLDHLRHGGAPQLPVSPFGASTGMPSGSQDAATQPVQLPQANSEAEAAPINESWRQAMALRQRLGDAAMWNPPPLMPFDSGDATAISEDGRWLAIIYDEGLTIVELRTMTAYDTGIAGWVSPEISWAPGGQGLAVIDDFRDRYMVLPMTPQGPGQPRFLQQLAQDDVECFAISPDLNLIAAVDDWNEDRLVLMDANSGSMVRELKPDDAIPHDDDGYRRDFDGRRVFFSPDGRIMAVSGYYDTVFYDTQGGTGHLRSGHVAFSPDGQAMAYVPYDEDELIRVVKPFDPSRIGQLHAKFGETLKVKLNSPEGLRFSPDGRLLSCISRRDGEYEVVVLDLSTGQELWRAQAPYQGGLPIDSIEYAAVTSDGRLFTDAYTFGGPYSGDTSWHNVHVASVAQQRYLGSFRLLAGSDEVGGGPKVYIGGQRVDPSQLAQFGFQIAGGEEPDEEAKTEMIPILQGDTFPEELIHGRDSGQADGSGAQATEPLQPEIQLRGERLLVGYTAEGLFARLDAQPFVHAGGQAVSSYERQDATRARLLGAPLHQVVGPEESALIEDVDKRRAYFAKAKVEGRLPADANLHELVAASRGLTPWLPYLMEAAKSTGSGVAGFGQGQGSSTTVTQEQLMQAFAQFGQRDEATKQVLFEQQCQTLHAGEQERQRQIEAQHKAERGIGGLFGSKKKQAAQASSGAMTAASGSTRALADDDDDDAATARAALRGVGILIQIASILFALGYIMFFGEVFASILPMLGSFGIGVPVMIGLVGGSIGSYMVRMGSS